MILVVKKKVQYICTEKIKVKNFSEDLKIAFNKKFYHTIQKIEFFSPDAKKS